jgi:phage terminase small subunit
MLVLKIPHKLDLSADEKKVWRHVAEQLGDQLIDTDRFVLEAFCRHFCRWRRLAAAEQAAVESGNEYEARRIGRNLSGAQKCVEASMSKLGLSPKDRRRLGGSGTPGLSNKINPLLSMLKDR